MRLSERSLRLTMHMLTDGSATTGPEVLPPSGNRAGSPGTSTMKFHMLSSLPLLVEGTPIAQCIYGEREREANRESLSLIKRICAY